MTDTLKRLDFLIDEVREVAFAQANPRDAVAKLLEGAKKFIELSESNRRFGIREAWTRNNNHFVNFVAPSAANRTLNSGRFISGYTPQEMGNSGTCHAA